MRISKETLSVLKTLSGVNTNLLIKPGNKLSTLGPQKNLMAEVTVAENFPVEFGIYDLTEFLGVISLFTDADVEFTQKIAKISEGKSSIKYFAADSAVLVHPTKELKFPAADVVFDLPAATLAMGIKTAGVLRSQDVSFVGDGTDVRMVVSDLKNPNSNSFDLVVGETDKTFNANLKVENLKMMPGDYKIELSSKKISRFTNKNIDAVFFVALESSSKMD